jgi:RimJ/RimL family protein N-acetyltransferase
MKNPYIVGKLCYLRTPEEDDANSHWYEWFSDPIITKFLLDRFWPNSKNEQLNFIRNLIGSREKLVLLICDSSSDSILGVCALSNINWPQRYADFSIVMSKLPNIDPRVALEGSTMLLSSAFNRLNLLNIRAATVSSNLPSLTLTKLLGFKQVGIFPNLFKIDGQFSDLIYSHLNIESWNAERLK